MKRIADHIDMGAWLGMAEDLLPDVEAGLQEAGKGKGARADAIVEMLSETRQLMGEALRSQRLTMSGLL